MTLLGLLVYLLIAGVVGTAAQFVVGFGRGGFLVATIIGLLGAFIGTALAGRIGLPVLLPVTVEGQTIEVVWAFLGAVVLMLPLTVVRGPTRGRRF